jgi:hypothetical protein
MDGCLQITPAPTADMDERPSVRRVAGKRKVYTHTFRLYGTTPRCYLAVSG